ncbi:MAG: DUF962 domain-containing protein [Chloracidobacterium sp.]|nr:DUF962 domain-containing protein [Chloracidobacterium sp.]MCC6825566.1 DUF962 domain-containing protein [Acidobacteriota bacterium]MCO5334938.1 DUF962 domain-containing protein [Pyrinomonadaceae bacterium]
MIRSYAEFWEFYVEEHSKPLTRLLHLIGTVLSSALLVRLIVAGTWYYFPLCLLIGYGFAWTGHFFVERNRPATFKYPLWSLISDYKMVIYMLTGRMNAEAERILAQKLGFSRSR